MTAKTRTELAGVFINGYIPQASDFGDVFDSFHNTTDDGTPATLGTNTFTGPQLFGGNRVEGFTNKVVTGVAGLLTIADHSGNILKTAGNVTIPTTAGFTANIIAGGAHTVTFNSTTSPAMATGDIMSVFVESSTIIHASLLPVAGKVVFS
jgi:hypothetical protein